MEQIVRTIDPGKPDSLAPTRARGAPSPASELYRQWGENGFDTHNLTFSTGNFIRFDSRQQNRSNFIKDVYLELKVI